MFFRKKYLLPETGRFLHKLCGIDIEADTFLSGKPRVVASSQGQTIAEGGEIEAGMLHSRVKEKRRINMRALPNFFRCNTDF